MWVALKVPGGAKMGERSEHKFPSSQRCYCCPHHGLETPAFPPSKMDSLASSRELPRPSASYQDCIIGPACSEVLLSWTKLLLLDQHAASHNFTIQPPIYKVTIKSYICVYVCVMYMHMCICMHTHTHSTHVGNCKTHVDTKSDFKEIHLQE